MHYHKIVFFSSLKNFSIKLILVKLIQMVFIVYLVCSCSNINKKEEELKISYNSDEYISIYNAGRSPIEFKVLPNNKDFSSLDNIVSYIKDKAKEFPEKPLEICAWEFVYNNTFHDKDIVIDDWTRTTMPELILSSVGGGLCGTRSAVLTNILVALGYKARSWCIEGHVVTEVFSDGRWKVLDPDSGVYFFNDEKQIASYKELCDNPQWFNDTARCVFIDSSESKVSETYMYYAIYAHCFSSVEDNRVFYTNFDYKLENENIYFLPEGAELIMPWENSERGKFYLCAKLIIPSNYKGKIKIPLVLDKIEGKGKIKFNKKRYEIDGCMTNFGDFNLMLGNFSIIENHGMEFYFFINPQLFFEKEINNIIIKSSDIKELDVEKVKRGEDEVLLLPHFKKLLMNIFYNMLEEYAQNHNIEIFDSSDKTIKYLCDTCCDLYFSKTVQLIDTLKDLDIMEQKYFLNQLEYFIQNKCDCKNELELSPN
jgi:hypothetical protein